MPRNLCHVARDIEFFRQFQTFGRQPLYAFQRMHPDVVAPGDLPCEFPGLFAAVEEAKHVPAELELKVDCTRPS